MPPSDSRSLPQLQSDFTAVTGRPFEHFFCPFLYRDEPATLCDGHVINEAFEDSPSTTVPQRQDIDSWYGSMFEADWVVLQERGKHHLQDVLADKNLARKLRPQIWRDGEPVSHYVAQSEEIPATHTPIRIEGIDKPLQFVLKIDPSVVLSKDSNWEVSISRDLRLPALVSLLKAAHLTLFHMLGYRYVFSPGGRFLGHDTLGRFFIENSGRPKADVLVRARQFFDEHIGIVRPMLSAPNIEGTVRDGMLALCMARPSEIWAMLVMVRAAGVFHSVMVPTFSSPDLAARYLRFLKEPFPRFAACWGNFEGQHWSIYTKTEQILEWPAPAFD